MTELKAATASAQKALEDAKSAAATAQKTVDDDKEDLANKEATKEIEKTKVAMYEALVKSLGDAQQKVIDANSKVASIQEKIANLEVPTFDDGDGTSASGKYQKFILDSLEEQLERAKNEFEAAKEQYDDIENKVGKLVSDAVQRIENLRAAAEEEARRLEEEAALGGNGTPAQTSANGLTPEQEALLAQYYAALEAMNNPGVVLGANRNRVTTQKVTAAVATDEVEEAAPAEEKVEAPVKEVEEVAETPADDYKEVVEIEDTQTALAGSIPEEEKAGMSWWWLLIVAVFGGTGVAMYRNSQKKKAAAQTKSDK